MKPKVSMQKHPEGQKVDKKDLVNLDLYRNEIRLMQQKLDKRKETVFITGQQDEIEGLKHELNKHKTKLEKFRHTTAPPELENFFTHLHDFEEEFKVTRNKVNELLNRK